MGGRPEKRAGRGRFQAFLVRARERGVDGAYRRVHQAVGDRVLFEEQEA